MNCYEHLQRSAKVFVRGLENYVTALAYLLCLALPGSCLARFVYFLADLCITFIPLLASTLQTARLCMIRTIAITLGDIFASLLSLANS